MKPVKMNAIFSSVTLFFWLLVFTSCSRNTFYIVRHAEKAPATGAMMSSDVPLSIQGEQRAAILKELLKGKPIVDIFSTQTIRTTSTAKPLSLEKELPVHFYHPIDTLPLFIKRVKAIKKGDVLIVGHSNTVDDLVNQMVGKSMLTDLPETDYDNLFLIHRRGKRYLFAQRKF